MFTLTYSYLIYLILSFKFTRKRKTIDGKSSSVIGPLSWHGKLHAGRKTSQGEGTAVTTQD